MTIIEAVASLAIISVIMVSMAGIITLTFRNLEINGVAVNSINKAKISLDRTLINPNEADNINTVTIDTNATVNVLGTDVEVAFIKSDIEDVTGRGDASTEYFFAYYKY